MAKKTKRQVRAQREKSKRNKIKKMEIQDAKGISRKKKSFVISLKTYYILKIIGIVLIPVVYLVYSPLLILVIIYYIALFYFTIACQRGLNTSYLKAREIKLPKFDSAVALIILVLSFFGSSQEMGGRFGKYSNTFWDKLVRALKSFGSLHTGQRRLFGSHMGMSFSKKDPPEGFVPSGERPSMPPKDFSMDNIPLEFMFNQMFSTVITVLVLSISILGIVSLIITIKKIKNMNKEEHEVLLDNAHGVTEEEILKVLSFEAPNPDNKYIVNEE